MEKDSKDYHWDEVFEEGPIDRFVSLVGFHDFQGFLITPSTIFDPFISEKNSQPKDGKDESNGSGNCSCEIVDLKPVVWEGHLMGWLREGLNRNFSKIYYMKNIN